MKEHKCCANCSNLNKNWLVCNLPMERIKDRLWFNLPHLSFNMLKQFGTNCVDWKKND